MHALKQLRGRAALLVTVLGVVALVSGLGVAVVGFLAQAADRGVRTGLADRAGADVALRATLPLAADPLAQDGQVRVAIARSFADLAEPIAVDRTVAGDSSLRAPDATADVERSATLVSVPDLADRVTLVDGGWAAGPAEVTLQADAATLLDVAPGDRLLLGPSDAAVPVSVTGTWRVRDHLDPRWLGDTQVTDGRVDAQFGPVVVDESLWPSLGPDVRARWTIVPDRARLDARDLDALVADWDRVDRDWRGRVDDVGALDREGRMPRLAAEVDARLDGLRAVEPVVLLLLAAVALVTLTELGRLLTTTRAQEIALLWARGASPADIARRTAAEVGLAAVLGAVLGAGVAWAAGQGSGANASAAVLVPLATVAAAVLLVAGQAWWFARRQAVRDPSTSAGRGRPLVGRGAVVLVVLAAAVAVWQLRLYGSPVTPTTGGSGVDPVAVLAPVLLLVAVVLGALLAFPTLAALVERRSGRSTLTRLLAARTVARDAGLVATPVVAVATAVAALVVAAAYAATWSRSFDRTTELRSGGDVHASTTVPGLPSRTLDAIAALPGVEGVGPAKLQTGGDIGSVVAVTPATLDRLTSPTTAGFDAAEAAEAIRVDVPGPDVDAGTTSITVVTAVQGLSGRPALSLQVIDAYGEVRVLPAAPGHDAGPDPAGTDGGERLTSYDVTVPDALAASPGPWTVLALDVDASATRVPDGSGRFALVSMTALAGSTSTELALDPTWIPDSPSQPFATPSPDGSGLGFLVADGVSLVRLTPSFDDAPTDGTSVPLVLSRALSDRLGLVRGDRLSFALDGTLAAVDGSVAEIVPAVPGAPDDLAVLLDLGVVDHLELRALATVPSPQDLWIGTGDPVGVAAAVRPLLPANARVTTAVDRAGRTVLGAAATAWWLGAAGCAALALVAVGAVVREQLRVRRIDVAVLRALGLSARDQAASRRRELTVALAYGATAGLAAGGAVAVLTVPQLARAAVPDPYDTVGTMLALDVTGLAVGLVALAVPLALAVAAYGARVAVQARAATGAGETR